jgi:predicted nucleotidyltransferase
VAITAKETVPMLAELLGSGLRAKIIGWLFTHPDEEFFVRQLEALLGEDSTNLSRELARLERLGILTCQPRGRQKHYRANPACPIHPELRSIASKTAGLTDILKELLKPLSAKIIVAFVYGSQARGTSQAASDVDLMVVGKMGFGEVVAALQPAQEKLGREINPTVYSKVEFRAKLREGHHFVKSVMEGPKLFVIGDERELAGLGQKRMARRA